MKTVKIGSKWKARDGRIMLVDAVDGGIATLTVLNATGKMRRVTKMNLGNFTDKLWCAFLSPVTDE